MKKLILLFTAAISVAISHAQETWYPVTVPSQEKLNDVQFTSESIGYIIGENATLLKTTDGGRNWSSLTFTGISAPWNTSGNFTDIQFVDDLNGFLVIENHGSIYETNDGGNSWTSIPNNATNQCFPATVYPVTNSDLFVGGSDCFQGATINRVQNGNWTNQTVNYQTFDTQHYVRGIDFEGTLGLAAVNNEYMLRSTDNGVTWDSVNTNIGTGNFLTSVFIASNDTCYAGYDMNGGGFGVLFSKDAGLTWEMDFNSATFYYPAYYGFTEAQNGDVYCGAQPSFSETGLIFEYSGGGWNTYTADHPIYAMDSHGLDTTFAVGDSGLVLVNQDFLSVGLEENSEMTEDILIYPNPMNSHFKIDCGDCQVLSVHLIDITGREVFVETKTYTSEIELPELPTGTYTVLIRTTSGTVTRKVTLQ